MRASEYCSRPLCHTLASECLSKYFLSTRPQRPDDTLRPTLCFPDRNFGSKDHIFSCHCSTVRGNRYQDMIISFTTAIP